MTDQSKATDQLQKRSRRSETLESRPNIRTTQRDLDIIRLIAENQFLTTEQICFLCFPSLHRTRKRLNRLWRHRLLNRTIMPYGLVGIPPQAIYSVATRGVTLLRLHGIAAPSGRRSQMLNRPGSLLFLNHTLNRNSFRIALEKAVGGSPSISLSHWKNDQANTIPVRIPVAGEPGQLSWQSIRPDASFSLAQDRHRVTCYLEIDNGTASLSRIALKALAYHRLRINRIESKLAEPPSARVLFVTFSEQRKQNIVARLQPLARERSVSDFWFVSAMEQAHLLKTNVIKELLWSVPARSGIRITSLEEEVSRVTSRQIAV